MIVNVKLCGSFRHAADAPPLEGLQIWKIKVAKMRVVDVLRFLQDALRS